MKTVTQWLREACYKDAAVRAFYFWILREGKKRVPRFFVDTEGFADRWRLGLKP